MKKVIEFAKRVYGDHVEFNDAQTQRLQEIEALVRADERAAILPLLKGIDQTECESADGWWETSTGAEFGAGILAAIEARGNT